MLWGTDGEVARIFGVEPEALSSTHPSPRDVAAAQTRLEQFTAALRKLLDADRGLTGPDLFEHWRHDDWRFPALARLVQHGHLTRERPHRKAVHYFARPSLGAFIQDEAALSELLRVRWRRGELRDAHEPLQEQGAVPARRPELLSELFGVPGDLRGRVHEALGSQGVAVPDLRSEPELERAETEPENEIDPAPTLGDVMGALALLTEVTQAVVAGQTALVERLVALEAKLDELHRVWR
jgi:hypothetical protein